MFFSDYKTGKLLVQHCDMLLIGYLASCGLPDF